MVVTDSELGSIHWRLVWCIVHLVQNMPATHKLDQTTINIATENFAS